jgi:recombination protein U
MVSSQSLGLEFENECLRGAQNSFNYAVKIPDTRSLSGLVNKIINWIRNTHVVAKIYREQFGYLPAENNFIAMKAPYDILICHKGKTIAMECKQTKAMSLSFNNIKDHQIEELIKVAKAGGIGLFCVNFNNHERSKAKNVNEVYVLDINMFSVLYTKAKNLGINSIPIDDFRKYSIYVDRVKINGKYQVDFDKLKNL